MVIATKRYCFDLDNTLFSYAKVPGDYTTVEPIQRNIDFLKYLKRLGNVIILTTSREMKNSNHNPAKALAEIGTVTFDTL